MATIDPLVPPPPPPPPPRPSLAIQNGADQLLGLFHEETTRLTKHNQRSLEAQFAVSKRRLEDELAEAREQCRKQDEIIVELRRTMVLREQQVGEEKRAMEVEAAQRASTLRDAKEENGRLKEWLGDIGLVDGEDGIGFCGGSDTARVVGEFMERVRVQERFLAPGSSLGSVVGPDSRSSSRHYTDGKASIKPKDFFRVFAEVTDRQRRFRLGIRDQVKQQRLLHQTSQSSSTTAEMDKNDSAAQSEFGDNDPMAMQGIADHNLDSGQGMDSVLKDLISANSTFIADFLDMDRQFFSEAMGSGTTPKLNQKRVVAFPTPEPSPSGLQEPS